jgi:hypothetical protein
VDDLTVTEPTAPGEPGAAITEPDPAPAAPAAAESATAITQPIPVVTTERCAQCAAPLAHDQRYCLQCGEPRPHLGGPPSAVRPTADKPQSTPSAPPGFSPPGAPGAASTRNNTLALIAGVGVLLLAMGVGVLIGRAGVGTAKAPPAQVIAVGGASGATAPSATSPTTTTPTTETPAASSGGAKKSKEAKTKEPSGAGSSITKPAPASVLKNLNKGHESGQSYEEKSKNLPNVVLTK